MNKKCQWYHLILFLISMQTFSQNKFSELALTGRGDLILVGETHKLQKEAFKAFKKMRKEALNDGISIQIVSAYRSFKRQNKIWERKYKKYTLEGLLPQQAIKKIIEYSTIPGTSRHHWGTEIDIIDGFVKAPEELLITENYQKNGAYLKLKKWMDLHSKKFGFYLVYTNNPNRKGVKFEPWHYSYKKLSKPMLKEYLKVDLSTIIQEVNLKGKAFLNKEFLDKYLSNNILDINSKLK